MFILVNDILLITVCVLGLIFTFLSLVKREPKYFHTAIILALCVCVLVLIKDFYMHIHPLVERD